MNATKSQTDQERLSIVQQFHGEAPDREMCLGAKCPDKNCRICPAAGKGRGRLLHDSDGNTVQSEATWDSYRASVKGGYYSTSIIEVIDPITGKKKYIYSRPGG